MVLELQPCLIRDGITKRRDGKSLAPLWSYSGFTSDSDVSDHEWESLEEGLMFLLDKLLPKLDLILAHYAGFDIYWWCGHFQQSFEGGPTFSPELLRKLSDFGVKLYLKNYHCN